MTIFREGIKEEARKLQICALYSAKGHFCAAGGWKWLHYLIGIPLTAVGVLAAIELPGHFSVLFGTYVAILSALMTFLNPNAISNAHFTSGKMYDVLYNKARQFNQLNCSGNSGISDECLKEALDKLYARKYELDDSSLKIPLWAYKLAKRGIKKGEASYDDKID